MKYVSSIRAKRTSGCAGTYGIDAEAVISVDDASEVYAHANLYDGERHYTIGNKSIYDFMTGDAEDPHAEFSEEYDNLSETEESEYHDAFLALDVCLKALDKSIGE